MKWWFMLTVIVLMALLSLDFSNALWQTRQARQNLQGFILVKEGLLKDIYPVSEPCPSRFFSCSKMAADISFDLDDHQYHQTSVYFVPYQISQIGQTVALLCDKQQGMCLPREEVANARSIWRATWLFRLFFKQ